MLCITGIEKNLAALKRRLKRNEIYPLQEIRLDALERKPTSFDFIPGNPKKIIATCRRQKDHGFFRGPEEERLNRLEAACAHGVGWVDLEADLPESSYKKILSTARSTRTKILRSLHLGDEAGPHEIQGAFSLLARSQGDAIKLAVPLDDTADLVAFARAPTDRPAVLVGSGPVGLLSRALYSRFNSAWTYFAASKTTAPLDDMPDVTTARLLGLPLDVQAPFFVLLGGASILGSPGYFVYNTLFREHSFNACYLPAVTQRPRETFELLKGLGLAGASVTIPHKVAAAGLADDLDEEAHYAKSVNTLYMNEGLWRGANTDLGAISIVAARLGTRAGQRALILGTGGFAKAGAWALADLGINVILLGRTLIEEPGPWEDCLPLKEVSRIPFHILFNATPLGGSKGNSSPIPKTLDLQGKIVIDGVLTPGATTLVRRAQASNSKIGTGVDLWAEQGAAQLTLFRCPHASPEKLKTLALKSGMVSASPGKQAKSRRKTQRKVSRK